MSTPDFILMTEFSWSMGAHDTRTLPAGAFVKPCELCYVPKHVIESERHRFFDKEKDVFCYTHYGFTAIPKKLIRRV